MVSVDNTLIIRSQPRERKHFFHPRRNFARSGRSDLPDTFHASPDTFLTPRQRDSPQVEYLSITSM
jgi:hypothetical protein